VVKSQALWERLCNGTRGGGHVDRQTSPFAFDLDSEKLLRS
jgi:hypothetical protein